MMKEMVKSLFIKYRHLIMYATFGVLTTSVNFLIYYMCYNIIGVSNVISTVVAWIFSVAFAFVTNKLWVFGSKSFDKKTFTHEISAFFGARFATGILDVVVMYAVVDVLCWNPAVWKLINNIIVIVLNYVASKLVIFRRVSKIT